MDAVSDTWTPGPLSLEAPALQLGCLGEWLAGWALSLQAAAQDPTVVVRMGAEMEQLGLEMQALVHALRGVRPVEVEALDLQSAAAQVVEQWQPALSRAGVRATLRPGPALEQELEAGLVQHALDLLLAHGLSGGKDLELAVSPSLDGAAVLRMGCAGSDTGQEELHWLLLRLLARARGWQLRRRQAAEGGDVDIVLRLAPASLGEEADPADEGLPRRQLDRSMRVLVVDPHEASRVESARLLTQAGMRCDCVATPAQAQELLLKTDPGWTALVAGLGAEEPGMEALVQTLRERYGLSRWIELVDERYRFDIAAANGSHPARLGRLDLAKTLVTALAG